VKKEGDLKKLHCPQGRKTVGSKIGAKEEEKGAQQALTVG